MIFCNFILKQGDRVWVNIIPYKGKKQTRLAEINGFNICGIYYEDHPIQCHHYCQGLFYGFGYHSDGYVIVCKKKWHLYPAILIEKIRLKLPNRWAFWLHLENSR